MPSQKWLVKDLSDSDLLSQLEDDSDTSDISSPEDDVIIFLNTFKLKAGVCEVQGKSLYTLYKHWSNNSFSYLVFCRKLNILLGQEGSPFMLNHSAEELSLHTSPKSYTRKKPTENKNLKKHLSAFLRKYNIVEGDMWTTSKVIFNLYDKWCYETNVKHVLRETTFEEVMRTLIKCRKTKNGAHFAINQETIKHLPKGFEDDNSEKEEAVKQETKS